MANLDHAECPNCYKVANGQDEVRSLFGTRIQLGKYETVQSWCMDCRGSS